MFESTDEIIRVATGTLVEMNEMASRMSEAGIRCRVVGDDLEASVGTILTGSVELWVLAADAERAQPIVDGKRVDSQKTDFPHPKSDPKPDKNQGPHHFPERHRPNP